MATYYCLIQTASATVILETAAPENRWLHITADTNGECHGHPRNRGVRKPMATHYCSIQTAGATVILETAAPENRWRMANPVANTWRTRLGPPMPLANWWRMADGVANPVACGGRSGELGGEWRTLWRTSGEWRGGTRWPIHKSIKASQTAGPPAGQSIRA